MADAILTTELTRPQTAGRGALFAILGDDGATAAPPPTLTTYREMRSNPTIALARVVATLPIRTLAWTLEADEGVPEERVVWLQDELDRLWPRLVLDLCRAQDFGFSAFEKVWRPQGSLLTLHKVKYLWPEKTQVLVSRENGSFAGLRQGEVVLPPEKCLVYSYDREGDEFYGRSRLENAREHAYAPWVDAAKKLRIYVRRAAGATVALEYPEGESQASSGQKLSNFEVAQRLLARFGQGDGVAMPNTLAGAGAVDLARAGIDPEKWRAWRLTFLEAGNHGDELLNTLRHYESLMLRGALVPERTALEGQAGTKAEAEAHGDLALALAALDAAELLRHLNDYLLAPWCALNWGPDAAGSIRLATEATDSASRDFFRALVEKLLTSPVTAETVLATLQLDAILTQAGLPQRERPASVLDDALTRLEKA